MKREQLTCNDLDLREVREYVRRAPRAGAYVDLMAKHFGIADQRELIEWLALHGFRPQKVEGFELWLVPRR